MSKQTHKLLMILLSLALAVSPLRAAWALSMTAPTDADSHCEQMQQDSNDPASAMVLNDRNTGSGNPCNEGCNSTCCDDACRTGTHATPALSYTALVTPATCSTLLNNLSSDVFPDRTVIPPLRPPAPLQG